MLNEVEGKIDGCQMKKQDPQKYLVRHWMDGWKEGWVEGCKSRVKDCLQQSKIHKVNGM